MSIRYVLGARRYIPVLLLATIAQAYSLSLASQEISTSLVSTARAWLDSQDSEVAGAYMLLPLDSRVEIPSCNGGFEFSLPHPGNKTVLARCPGSDWSLYLQFRAAETSIAVHFASDLPAGHRLNVGDVTLPQSAQVDAAAQLSAFSGKFLRSAVRAGQPVNQSLFEEGVPAFRVRQSLAAGSDLDQSMFDQTVRPISTLPPGRQVAAKQLEGARSVRALPAGAIITLADIASRQAVLTAAVTIPRGTLLSSDNTTMGYYWGRMPHDAILEPAALPRATATSTLLPGQVLRISGIRSLPAVVKGEDVIVSIKRNLVEISQVMSASQDGQIGQQIELLNKESGGRIRAAVTGVGTATIP